jgi:hypothetical protein
MRFSYFSRQAPRITKGAKKSIATVSIQDNCLWATALKTSWYHKCILLSIAAIKQFLILLKINQQNLKQAKTKQSRNQLTHSSSTKKRQADNSSFPVEIKSSSRPGVPTTMST